MYVYIGTMNEHWKAFSCLYTSIWAQIRNFQYNVLGLWMSTHKCSDACIQAFGHKPETSSMRYCDDEWALTSVQVLVYMHLGTRPKLLVWCIGTMNEHWQVLRCSYASIWKKNAKLVVWYVGTMNAHCTVLRCLYKNIWAQVPNF